MLRTKGFLQISGARLKRHPDFQPMVEQMIIFKKDDLGFVLGNSERMELLKNLKRSV